MELDPLYPLHSLGSVKRKEGMFPCAKLLGALSLETNITSLCFIQRRHNDAEFSV